MRQMSLRRGIRPIKRIALFIAAAIILLGTQTDYASALVPADYIPQGINYYGDEVACKAAGGSFVSGNSEKEKIWNYLVGKGLTDEQAAGVMGNMQAESNLIPTRQQDGTGNVWHSGYGSAWGLAQWDGGRRFTAPSKGILGKLRAEKPHLEKYAAIEYDYHPSRHPDAKAKIPETDLNELIAFELDYLFQESQVRPVSAKNYGNAGNEWATLKLQKTVEDATVFWHNNFEVSDDSAAAVISNRGGAANGFFKEFAGKGGGASADTASSSSCAGAADTSSVTATIKSYAWPEYHAPDYITMKPEYKTAILAAQKKGEYVGGGINPGIDCGGFVMRVLRDSKFEPEYNSTGGPVATSQVPWVKANGWTKLGTGSTINVADLKPGDVVFYNWSGNPNTDQFDHTAIFAGKIDGFATTTKEYKGIASASYGGETQGTGAWRTPMAGAEDPTFAGAVWYRKG